MSKPTKGTWRNIKTAPKDGTEFLAYGDQGFNVVRFGGTSDGPHYSEGFIGLEGWHVEVTHWMPLPEEPNCE
jgi:hypothetical protein